MFLKSLVVRGFKSFADKTTLVFEPGISVVVGPNGSGKSNIVDSISWVLGEQGPRSLRGGKMEDVIFAGSRLRPALGMTEATLVIDNSAGLLPIEFAEVTISRTLFRSGESEYRLNGVPCRLLDIQEVLSDTGIGREQHTIIGQGELDEILTADPLTMRGFIEEAAGVAKHRRRKDRALRKIAATEGNVVRLSDLLSEIRRQLRPLREQAEVAKRHSALAEELGRVRLVLASRELAETRLRLGPGGSLDLDAPVRAKEAELTVLEQRLTQAERSRAEAFARSEGERDAAFALSRTAERLGAIGRLAQERVRSLEAELQSTTEAAARARVSDIRRELAGIEGLLAGASEAERHAAGELASSEGAFDAASRSRRQCEDALGAARAAQREAAAEAVRVRGEIAALAAAVQAAGQETSRTEERERSLGTALADGQTRLSEAKASVEHLEAGAMPLEEALAEIETEIATLEERRASAERDLREAESEASAWHARAEVWKGASPSAARRLAGKGIEGVAGILRDLVDAPPALHSALAALAGDPAAVLVVEDAEAAVRALEELKGEPVGILSGRSPAPAAPGAVPIVSIVGARHPAAERALAGVYLAGSAEEAVRLAAEHRDSIFVTAEGAVAIGNLIARSSADAAGRAAEAEGRVASERAAVAGAEDEVRSARARRDETAARLNRVDAAVAAAAERITGLEREVHALERERLAFSDAIERAVSAAASVNARLEALRATVAGVEARAGTAAGEVERLEEEQGRRSRAAEEALRALDAARVEAAKRDERSRLIEERHAALASSLEEALSGAAGVEDRREALVAGGASAAAVARKAIVVEESAARWAAEAEEGYRRARLVVEESEAAVADLRTQRAALAGALDDMRIKAREEDLGRSELRIRARILEERMREEWRVDPDEAAARLGHRWEVEDESRLSDPTERAAAMDSESLRRKQARLDRDLEAVGRVNPLAEQEFAALGEREEFLAAQIADVRRSRRDLFKVVTEVDRRICELFAAAFEDVAAEYERLFAMLFPGGAGRLRLTDPSDLLGSGVEVEARPGGKNLRRLSLLSGGEKALSALAILFAIFRARPSPFYVLDEVEAALDDVNLHRFLDLLREFRSTSQLIVVTHQKRTMEAADVLYGVSISPDGASRVISERLPAAAPAPEVLREGADAASES